MPKTPRRLALLVGLALSLSPHASARAQHSVESERSGASDLEAPRDAQGATVLVLPAAALGPVSTIVQLRILGILRNLGHTNLVHPKTLIRVNERYEARWAQLDDPRRLQALGRVTGSDVVVKSRVRRKNETTRLTVEIVPVDQGAEIGRRVEGTIEADTWLATLGLLSTRLAQLMIDTGRVRLPRDRVNGPIGPHSDHEEALIAYGRCHERIIRQPAGLRNPVVIDHRNLERALRECEASLSLDPDFRDAEADLALAHAFLGHQTRAERHLRRAKASSHFIPTYWIAKFWILSRFYDPNLALRSLEMALKEHPGFTLARGYLAEALVTLGRPQEAISVYLEYLNQVPRQSHVMGQLGYAHAKAGDMEKSIEWTNRALRVTPSDPELLLQLGSRLVDVGRYDEAAVLLKRVIAEGGARGEVYLRLGYTYLKMGELLEAERELRTAIGKADGPGEWRTRGRARYNLAILWLLAGSPTDALRHLELAVREGFKDEKAFKALEPLKDLRGYSDVMAMKPPRGRAKLVTPLGTISDAGEVEGVPEREVDEEVLDQF